MACCNVWALPDGAFFHKPGRSQFVQVCFAKDDRELEEASEAAQSCLGYYAWKEGHSITEIFEDIARERQSHKGRKVQIG